MYLPRTKTWVELTDEAHRLVVRRMKKVPDIYEGVILLDRFW